MNMSSLPGDARHFRCAPASFSPITIASSPHENQTNETLSRDANHGTLDHRYLLTQNCRMKALEAGAMQPPPSSHPALTVGATALLSREWLDRYVNRCHHPDRHSGASSLEYLCRAVESARMGIWAFLKCG
jgi:hypothetical protein